MSRRLTRRQSRERGLLPSAAYASILKQNSFLATGYAPQVARRPLKRMIFTAWSIACRFLKVFSNQARSLARTHVRTCRPKLGAGKEGEGMSLVGVPLLFPGDSIVLRHCFVLCAQFTKLDRLQVRYKSSSRKQSTETQSAFSAQSSCKTDKTRK